jgi:hypothetical protein
MECLLPFGLESFVFPSAIKVTEVEIHRSKTFPVLYGCETYCITQREEHRFRVCENRVLRRIFWPKKEEITGGWRNGIMRSFVICAPHCVLLEWSNRGDWDGQCMWHIWNGMCGFIWKVWMIETTRWEGNNIMDLIALVWEGMEWFGLAKDRDKWWAVVSMAMNCQVL